MQTYKMIRLEEEIHARLATLSRMNRRTMTQQLQLLLDKAIDEEFEEIRTDDNQKVRVDA